MVHRRAALPTVHFTRRNTQAPPHATFSGNEAIKANHKKLSLQGKSV